MKYRLLAKRSSPPQLTEEAFFMSLHPIPNIPADICSKNVIGYGYVINIINFTFFKPKNVY